MSSNAAAPEIIFAQAIDIPSPEERAAYLDQACSSDRALRAEVEKLVKDYFKAGEFLQRPVAHVAGTLDEPTLSERAGTMIGPYKLLQQIGEGGMGVVWMAEQTQPVQRKVAVKVIKAGMDSRQVIARFEAERQALAMMDHVNIARVFDGGTTGERRDVSPPVDQRADAAPLAGRPYFVMELVHGVPITKYCDDNHLTPRERLELFVPVCQAIQHAHQKGIIHRDIKPSNVMVTLYDGKPVPKVIDFGVAKATEQKLTERTLFTQYGTMVGTLEYMSPEQAEMSALGVDTRSDIYSLGVLLYELLTGSTPLSHKRLKEAAYAEVLRMIKEEEAPKPSTRLSDSGEALASISANRHTEPAKLTRLVKGELDWIVMKCLEKDRNRRYDTAHDFARDVQRYLADEPVQACPPSVVYRLKKFVRRNKGPVLAAAVVLLALVAGIVGTTWGLLRAESARQAEADQRERAEQEKQVAQAVRDFLQKKLLAQADTLQQADALLGTGGQSAEAKYNPTIRELLDRAAAELAPDKIDAQFPKQPLVQAAILQTIGETYTGIGEFGLAIDHLQRALDLRLRQLAPDHPDILDSLHKLAGAYHVAGKRPEAIRLFEQVRDKRAVNLGPDHPHTLDTMNSLAWAYSEAGKLPEAVALYEKTRKLREAKLGPDHAHTLDTMNGLAVTYSRVGRFKEATALHEDTLKLQQVKLGHDHPHTLTSMNNLGRALERGQRFKEAIARHEEALKRWTAKVGRDHPKTLISMNGLAGAYLWDGRLKEGLTLYQEARKRSDVKLGRDHPDTLHHMTGLAQAYLKHGRLKEAVTLYEETLDLSKAKLGPHHPSTLIRMQQLALAHGVQGDYAEAERLLRETLGLQRKILGPEHPRLHGTLSSLGQNLRKQQKYAEAEPIQRECLAIRVRRDPDDWTTFAGKAMLGDALLGQKKYADAEPLLVQGYEGLKQREAKIPAFYKARLTEALEGLVQLYEARSNPNEAARWRTELAARKAPPKEEKKPPPKN
jgi:serine/threonine protein kinase/tetratricopeptide (TPR) repeat protein